MPKEKKRFLITSALPYANGPLHVGHLSGAYLPADIYVRFLRLKKKDVVFICGSDENGAAITIKAKLENTTPQAIVDKYFQINKDIFEEFGISFDIFHRTSSELHHQTASDFFLKLHENEVFEQQTSEQYYDVEHHQFLADRYIYGTCPKCSYEHAYGDQCEKCGSSLSPKDLISPKSSLSEKEPVLKSTTHWYLPMEKHGDWLKKWIEEGILNNQEHHNPKEWKNNVLGQCKSWLDSGLQPRAMTRDLDWGIKVPLANAEGKVLYVWLDAPIGYISATKQWAIDNKKQWEPYWMDNDTKLVHFIGKDNIVFHCIIFPILLKAHGDFILPNNVPANEFLNLEGNKISTSRSWAVWVNEYLQDFPNKQDELRYVLTSISPENKDSEFTWKDYQTRINNELVANYGNFVNRTLVLTDKYYDGILPYSGNLLNIDNELINEFKQRLYLVEQHLEAYRFKEALNEAMNAARAGNKYLGDAEPWKLIKTDPERVKTILCTALQLTANLAGLFTPFLPNTSKKIFDLLKIKNLLWDELGNFSIIPANHKIGKPALLFEKVENEIIEKQLAKLQKKSEPENPKMPSQKPTIEFNDFTKLDIRIGEIIAAEKIPKTEKLIKLTVNTGIDKRTVVSGIANSYNAEEIIGKKVSILLNLSPRKIKGVLSEGMILMAENEDGNLSFISPEQESIIAGNEIR